jgi:tetratricopeptide (TPR) repeat protein
MDRANQTGYFFFHYLGTLLLPLKLAPVYDTLVPPTSFDGIYALANVAAVLVLAAAAFLALRRKFGLGLGLLAFVSLVFPMSPAVHAVTYTNDRYSQALGWIVAAVVILWTSRPARKAHGNRASIATSIFVVLALALTGSTLDALPRWESTESLLSWTLQTLQKPTRIRSSVLQRLAGYNANYEGDLEKASRRIRSDEVMPIEEKETLLRELSRLARPAPFVPVGAASLYLTAVDVDLPKNDFRSAASRLTEALRLMPDFWQAAFQLALIRLSEGEPEAAMANYNRAIEAAGDQMGPAIRDQFLAQVAAQKSAPMH